MTTPLTDEQIKQRAPVCADFVSFRAGVRCMERELAIPAGFALVPLKATPAIRDALRISCRRDWPSDELCDVRWAAAIGAANKTEKI